MTDAELIYDACLRAERRLEAMAIQSSETKGQGFKVAVLCSKHTYNAASISGCDVICHRKR